MEFANTSDTRHERRRSVLAPDAPGLFEQTVGLASKRGQHCDDLLAVADVPVDLLDHLRIVLFALEDRASELEDAQPFGRCLPEGFSFFFHRARHLVAHFRDLDLGTKKPARLVRGAGRVKLVRLDRYQPKAPRSRVVIVIMVVIVMLPARGIAALSSAQLPVLVSRLSMGSQKCMGAACASTLKGEIAKKSPMPW